MPTWFLLGVLGLLPFLALVAVPLAIAPELLSTTSQWFVYYSACISSFVAGTLWLKGNALSSEAVNYLSNIITLVAFIALVTPKSVGICLLLLAFIGLHLIERTYSLLDDKPAAYRTMRLYLTASVALLHLIMLGLLV